MARAILAAALGYAVWTAIWLVSNQALAGVFPAEWEAFADGGELRAAGPLSFALLASVIASLAAGWTTAALARARPWAVVLAMAAALFVTGVAVQGSAWSRMPLWYHVAFLALLVPACAAGAALRRR